MSSGTIVLINLTYNLFCYEKMMRLKYINCKITMEKGNLGGTIELILIKF